MTETLGDLLRRSADAVAEPRLDVNDLVARAGTRVRRRRVAVTSATAGLVAAVVVGILAARGGQPRELEPAPSPSPSPSPSRAVDPADTRPLVYAEGATVHVGDRSIEAEKPVAFVDATDDGAVYEAANDGRLWFTDGTTSSVIGTSPWTAAPTAHVGIVTTGDSGSLVVWPDVTNDRQQLAEELLVYDTSRLEVVGRIPVTGDYNLVLYVGEEHVYFNPDPDAPGCWVVEIHDIHHCPNPHLYRFDVATGETRRIPVADLGAEVGSRVFVRPPVASNDLGFSHGATFRQAGRRLVPVTVDGEDTSLRLAEGDDVRLQVPDGYTEPGREGSGGKLSVSQWLDDDHVVLFADDGGGDLPAKNGDFLVCGLPDGVCRVAVPRSSREYVAPWRST